jgi:RND superfamily putative drug exporter
MLTRLAATCMRHRRLVIATWALFLVAGFACAPALFGRLESDVGTIDGTESQRASELLWRAAPSGEEIYAIADDVDVRAPEVRAAADRVAATVGALPGVESVRTPWRLRRDRAGSGRVASPGARSPDRRR